jgi:hypothetical protein
VAKGRADHRLPDQSGPGDGGLALGLTVSERPSTEWPFAERLLLVIPRAREA